MKAPLRISLIGVTVFSILGCAEYSFDINKNEVYTPAPIYTDFSLADSGLRNCIDQTIKDKKLTSSQSVTRLQCSYSGVSTIEGIAKFSRLEKLSLKGNNINKIDELLQLTYLEYLDLSDNPISDCQTLGQLQTLVTETLIQNTDCKTQ